MIVYKLLSMDHLYSGMKNSIPRDRNTEQDHTFKINSNLKHIVRTLAHDIMLFGTTVSKKSQTVPIHQEITPRL